MTEFRMAGGVDTMMVTFHPFADIAIIDLYEGRYLRSQELEDERFLDFDGNDDLVRITFLHVSKGVRLDGIPGAADLDLARVLTRYNVKVLD